MKNYYQILGVPPTASADEIREAYRRLSKRVHPDVNWGDRIFEELFKDINEAYQELSDEGKRAAYNRKFHHFFFSTGLPEEFVQQQKVEAKRLFKRKIFINSGVCLLLVSSVVAANSMFFNDGENARLADAASKDVSATVNEVLFSKDEEKHYAAKVYKMPETAPEVSARIITAGVNDLKPVKKSEVETAPSSIEAPRRDVKPAAPNYPTTPVKETRTEATPLDLPKRPIDVVRHDEKSTVKQAEVTSIPKKTMKAEPVAEAKKAASKPTAVKRQWTDAEMAGIAKNLSAKRAMGLNKTISVKLVSAANTNITNPFDLASFLQKENFSISGRGTTSKSVNGILFSQQAACITITIGKN